MNKNFFIAWAVVFVVWMAGGFVVHGVLLGTDYAQLPQLFRAEKDSAQYFHFMLLAHVIMAGAFTWIYARGQENKPWLGQGVRFGIAVALLAAVPTYMMYFVVQPMPAALAVKQAIFDGILCVLLGIIVAFLYRNQTKA